MKLAFTATSFSSTQGQWWPDTLNKGIERRVTLVASQFDFLLWTASFREASSGRMIVQKWFCSESDHKPLALFDNIADRRLWMEEQWEKKQRALHSW